MICVQLVALAVACSNWTQESPPFAPIAFLLPNSSTPIPYDDVNELKLKWKSREPVSLPSGALGQYDHGSYLIVSKDVPLLAFARAKFQLARHIVEKSSKSRGGAISINGSEFERKDLETLSALILRWTGMKFDVGNLMQTTNMKFLFRSDITYGREGEFVTYSPKISFTDTSEALAYSSGISKCGLLNETKSESEEYHSRAFSGRIVGTESEEGIGCTRVFHSYSTKTDYVGIIKHLYDFENKINAQNAIQYRTAMLDLTTVLRGNSRSIFVDLNNNSASDADAELAKEKIVSYLIKAGSSASNAESEAASFKYAGRDFAISFVTGLKRYGIESKASPAVTINIWP